MSSLSRTGKLSTAVAEVGEYVQNQFFTVIDVKLSKQSAHMCTNCWYADLKIVCDLFVGKAVEKATDGFSFAWRQRHLLYQLKPFLLGEYLAWI
jgi:hypothetical protein